MEHLCPCFFERPVSIVPSPRVLCSYHVWCTKPFPASLLFDLWKKIGVHLPFILPGTEVDCFLRSGLPFPFTMKLLSLRPKINWESGGLSNHHNLSLAPPAFTRPSVVKTTQHVWRNNKGTVSKGNFRGACLTLACGHF